MALEGCKSWSNHGDALQRACFTAQMRRFWKAHIRKHRHTHPPTPKNKKVAPNTPEKKDEAKEGGMEYLVDASQRKRSRGVAV